MAATVLRYNSTLPDPILKGTSNLHSQLALPAYMTAICEVLQRLGLSQYHDSFVAEAFDTWEVLVDIKETDLAALNVRLGHRRILQKAISEYRRSQLRDTNLQPQDTQTLCAKTESAGEDSDLAVDTQSSSKATATNGDTSGAPGAKRKYRRHPRPDENAPDRPPSAYVIFSNQVRHTLKDRDFSFTEIAKIVGERWQVLAPNEKEVLENRSQTMKERYYNELADYKKTSEYADYQAYLAEFKAKHDPAASDLKRSRKDEKHSDSRRSNSSDKPESETDPRSYNTERGLRRHDRPPPVASPPIANTDGFTEWRFRGTGAVYEETGPRSRARSVVEPLASPAYSPTVSMSLGSSAYTFPATAFRPSELEYIAPIENPADYASAISAHFMRPSHAPCVPIDIAIRRTARPIDALPSLPYNDTGGSTPSSASSSSLPPPMEHSRAIPNRQLPRPILSRQMHIGKGVPPPLSPQAPGEPNPASGFATLLYAGEQLATKSSVGRDILENGRGYPGHDNGHIGRGHSRSNSNSYDQERGRK